MARDGRAAQAIDDYVEHKNPAFKALTDALRALVRKAAPKSREILNPWGIPTFQWNGPLCFFLVGKKHVTFGFPRGAALEDPAELLEGAGKSLRHVKVREISDLHDANLKQLILQAKRLNREEALGPAMRSMSGRKTGAKPKKSPARRSR